MDRIEKKEIRIKGGADRQKVFICQGDITKLAVARVLITFMQAKITKGYDLPADYVIHTVGPVYSGSHKDAELLADCYWNCLELAKAHGIGSIAFPAISTGVYGYPLKEAVPIAAETVLQWMREHEDYEIEIIFCCFDRRTYEMYQEFLSR